MRLGRQLILLSLLCNFLLVLSSNGMFREYIRKWPHCTNIRCFRHDKLTKVQELCMASPECDGFSFKTGRSRGSGCLKKNCRPDYVKGYGSGTHDYYRKYMFREYKRKWPHCTNIRCFWNSKLKDLQQRCMASPKCNGFSFSTGRSRGWGCLKKNCRPDHVNGYGYTSHDYYSKDKYLKKYVSKWPHCTNLGRCFKNMMLHSAKRVCIANRRCDGFSFTHNAVRGRGCYKTKCRHDRVKGYGYRGYDYYKKL